MGFWDFAFCSLNEGFSPENNKMKKYAILVGLNNYDSLGKLKYARHDAEDFAADLKMLCGFVDYEIFLMTCRSAGLLFGDKKNLESALERARNFGNLDLLIFGFWGHGFSPLPGSRFICPLEANVDHPLSESVSLDYVRERLSEADAENTLLILDCCQNNPQSRSISQAMTIGEEAHLAAMARDISHTRRSKQKINNPTVAILNSCRERQKAYEWDEKKHGVFTAFLLEALNKGKRSVVEIASWLSENVPLQTKKIFGQDQNPYFLLEGKSDIVFPSTPERKQEKQKSPAYGWNKIIAKLSLNNVFVWITVIIIGCLMFYLRTFNATAKIHSEIFLILILMFWLVFIVNSFLFSKYALCDFYENQPCELERTKSLSILVLNFFKASAFSLFPIPTKQNIIRSIAPLILIIICTVISLESLLFIKMKLPLALLIVVICLLYPFRISSFPAAVASLGERKSYIFLIPAIIMFILIGLSNFLNIQNSLGDLQYSVDKSFFMRIGAYWGSNFDPYVERKLLKINSIRDSYPEGHFPWEFVEIYNHRLSAGILSKELLPTTKISGSNSYYHSIIIEMLCGRLLSDNEIDQNKSLDYLLGYLNLVLTKFDYQKINSLDSDNSLTPRFFEGLIENVIDSRKMATKKRVVILMAILDRLINKDPFINANFAELKTKLEKIRVY